MNHKRFIILGSVLGVLGALFLFVASTSSFTTLILPQSYRSTARISVERILPDSSTLPHLPMTNDPYLILAELERIRQAAILRQVITNLNLNKTWVEKINEESALPTKLTFGLILRQLDVRQGQNTSLIEISVENEDKMEAPLIANDITKAYRDARNGVPSGVHVEIIEQAVPALRPSKPGRAVVIFLFSGAVLAFVVGLGLLIASFIQKRTSPLPSPLAPAS